MLENIRKKLSDKGGGTCVPVVFPLVLVLLSIACFFVLDPLGKSIISNAPWDMVKMITFLAVLVGASMQDFKTMEVSNGYTFALLGIGLLNVSLDSFVGGAICFAIFMLVAMLTNLGGADVKIAGACGFVLGTLPSLIALLIGLALSVVIELIITIIKRNGFKRNFPLVPYITIGCIAVTIMKGLNLL